MTYALEFTTIGKRNARPPVIEILPADVDPLLRLATWLEGQWQQGALIVASKGNANTFAVCPRPVLPWHDSILRVRIIEIAEVKALAS